MAFLFPLPATHPRENTRRAVVFKESGNKQNPISRSHLNYSISTDNGLSNLHITGIKKNCHSETENSDNIKQLQIIFRFESL